MYLNLTELEILGQSFSHGGGILEASTVLFFLRYGRYQLILDMGAEKSSIHVYYCADLLSSSR
jgi:hypothetical protein